MREFRVSSGQGAATIPAAVGRTAQEKSAVVKIFPEFFQALQEGELEGPKSRMWKTCHVKTTTADRPGFLRKLFESRYPSFGRSFAANTIPAAQFVALGAATAVTAQEISSSLGCGPIELYAVAWHIEGLNTAAVVRFSCSEERWLPTGAECTTEQLQERYFLDNYDFG